MGRDWSWLGGGGKKKSSKKDIKTTPSLSPVGNTATAAGCMSAVFNIFDFHHLQFPLNHHQLHLPKGVEPPRNSLESTAEEEEEEEKIPFSPTRKDGNLNISMGFKIKTKPEARSSFTSTESYSPTIKTPTLVARLMGLDLVPDNLKSSSPTPSCPSTRSSHTNKHGHYSLQRNSIDGGTRSLPETPRISLGRRSVDVNYERQRSSLHLNNIRESGNNNVKIHEDKENKSPGDYAKQIVMQFKENVSRRRRMGNDITNVRSKKEEQSKETHESKKASSLSSPRLEIPKTKPTSTSKLLETTVKIQDKTRLPTLQEEPHQEQRKSVKKCKKLEKFKFRLVKEEPFIQSPVTSNNNNGGFLLIQGDKTSSSKKPEKFKSRLVKPPQTMQEEPFIRSPATTNNNNNGDKASSSKKTPLSINELINFTTVPSLHTIKKQDSSSPHKSVKIRETQSHRNRAQEPPLFPNQSQPHISINGGELEYITRTLRRTGIDKDTPISYAKWFSPTHPLDPSIFYFLEHFAVTSTKRRNSPENLSFRSNRKLLFHLLDEILADILKPQINSKPWLCSYSIQSQRNLKGSELIDEISRRIEKFPLAKCLVLEDIDALIAGDIPETTAAFEEESEGIVTEVEKSILETLVTETTMDYYATWIKTASLQYNNNVSSGTWGVHVTRHSSKVGSHYLRNPRG